MSEIDIKAIEARAAKAVDGPWHAGNEYGTVDGVEILFTDGCIGDTAASTCGEDEDRANADFIAHARTDISALIARIRELEGEKAQAYQAVGAMIYHYGLGGNADAIRLQDILAYGKTEDGIELLPWPEILCLDRVSVSALSFHRRTRSACTTA